MTPAWPDPALAAVICAVDPCGLGGIAVHAPAGPSRDRWLALLAGFLPAAAPVRRLPVHADDHRIFGGLDLTASLAAGRPIQERGLLAEADGGLLVLSMAERLPAARAGRLAAALEAGRAADAGEGAGAGADRDVAARIGFIAFDEGVEGDERPPDALLDRLAFWIDLSTFDPAWTLPDAVSTIAAARAAAAAMQVDDTVLRALCETAAALGILSLRAPLLALKAARIVAALAGRSAVADQDAAVAARLVLAPRARHLPAEPPPKASAQSDEAGEQQPAPEAEDRQGEPRPPAPLDDVVLAAAVAAIPPGLLDRLRGAAVPAHGSSMGRAGAPQRSPLRGRPAGLRAGLPRGGARLALVATLRAAAPWQRLRGAGGGEAGRRIAIRRDDLRVLRFKRRGETTTIVVVDASGSLVLNRLAEAKGAVLLLLAECYVRRDEVALLAFRGQGAELLLPPTRSLARARRCLADLPGGGATPLAHAIDAATALADAVRRRGRTPLVVFLTDGRANVARDGSFGRPRAEEDARLAAQAAAAAGLRMLVVDAAQRPQPAAQALATTLRARYLAMPRAEADGLSRAVLAAGRS